MSASSSASFLAKIISMGSRRYGKFKLLISISFCFHSSSSTRSSSRLLKSRLSRTKISPASSPSLRSRYTRNSSLSTLSTLFFLFLPFTSSNLRSKTQRSSLGGINDCGKSEGLYSFRLLFFLSAVLRNAAACSIGSSFILLSKGMERNRCRKRRLHFGDSRAYCFHL